MARRAVLARFIVVVPFVEVGQESDQDSDRLVEIGDLHALVRIVAAVAVAHEEHGARHPGLGEGGSVMPSPARKERRSDAKIAGGPRKKCDKVRRHGRRRPGEAWTRVEADAAARADLGEERMKPRFDPFQDGAVGAAHVEGEANFAQNAAAAVLGRVGLDATESEGRFTPVAFERVPLGFETLDEVGEAQHRVTARKARLGAGMGVGAAADSIDMAKASGNACDDARRRAGSDQTRPLLDMHLDESGDA